MTIDAWRLIDTAGPAALDRGPRAGVASAATLSQRLSSALTALAPARRDAALALALLWHDDLDGAHHLCQAHEGHADCDYVHALLHRREGDFGNAKYWFREVGDHPVYATVALAATNAGEGRLVERGSWQPAAMIDACAAALGPQASRRPSLMQVQAAEFQALAVHLFTP